MALPLAALLFTAFFAGRAQAAVDLRVESRPVTGPIEAYVTITNSSGNPVGGLTASDFSLSVDGKAVTVQPSDLSLPPAQTANRSVSVVFVMDYSQSTEGAPRTAMENAVLNFLNGMSVGDYAAIVKFNGESGATVVQAFTPIATGLPALLSAAVAPYSGRNYTNLYDATHVALQQFEASSASLPAGPRAVIVLSDGLDNCDATKCPKASNATFDSVLAEASADGLPLFSISLSAPNTQGDNVMQALSARTGGDYLTGQDPAAVTTAYQAISTSLANEYLVTFPSSITDCGVHTIQVTVQGQTSSSVKFTRCDAPKTTSGSGHKSGGGAIGVPDALLGSVALLVMWRRRRVA